MISLLPKNLRIIQDKIVLGLIRRISFLLFLFFTGMVYSSGLFAKTGIGLNLDLRSSDGLRISMLTCGSGEELYSIYGHSALRIVDSNSGKDIVYNYGTFNFDDPNFIWKFTRGKLPYYLSADEFFYFMMIYKQENRSVFEQVLDLSMEDKVAVKHFLENNLLEGNKYYKYDFLLDNCSTRVADVLRNMLGKRLVFGKVIAEDSVSFRTYLNQYERNLHWERVGINLLMSDIVDRNMKNEESFFLPDFLMKGMDAATLDGKPLVKETLRLLPEKNSFSSVSSNTPKQILWGLLLLISFFSFSSRYKKYLFYFDVLFFMLLGLLGGFMLFMWFGTDHKVCAWNRNLFWAFPLHVVFAFLIAKKSELVPKYASAAISLLMASIFFGIVAEQEYISEITPLLLLILLRLGSYRMVNPLLRFQMKGFKGPSS